MEHFLNRPLTVWYEVNQILDEDPKLEKVLTENWRLRRDNIQRSIELAALKAKLKWIAEYLSSDKDT